MRRALAGLFTLGLVGAAGGLGTGVAVAEPRWVDPMIPPPAPAPIPVGADANAKEVYALGGARAPGIPWYDYTNRAGAEYFPTAKRNLVDYPAGAPFSWVPSMFLPPDTAKDNMSIGEAATVATNNLSRALRSDAGRSSDQPGAVVGLSQGTLGLDGEMVRLANDPNAPAPDKLTFTEIGNPIGQHGFGQSFLRGIFKPGDYIPFIDYTVPPKVDSQYDQNKIVATYDGLADFPDRPGNVISGLNALAASAIVHTPAAFTGPQDVPPQNIRTTVNSKGATETTYLIPVNHLPMTLPLRYIGLSPGFVDSIDSVLQPIVDAGYSRYDNPAARPVSVDPVHGMDPIAVLDDGTRNQIEGTFATIRDVLGPLP